MASYYKCSKILTLLVVLAVYQEVVRSFELNNEGKIRNHILNQANYSSRLRPVLNSDDPVLVSVGLQFFAMLELNERDQVITTSAWLTLSWKDELLKWDPDEFGGETLVPMYADEIWTPNVGLYVTLQSYSVDTVPHRSLINLQSDGTATFGMPIVQTTQCPVTVISFPFDKQVCIFFFYPKNQPGKKVSLFAKVPKEGEESRLETSEWTLTNFSLYTYAYSVVGNIVDNRTVNLTAAVFCIVLERYPDYFIKTLLIPSTLLCMMSFITFLVHPDSGERISMGVSFILGLTVFQILVAEILPEASKESPVLNRYLIVTFIIACLAVPVSLMNINIACGDGAIPELKSDQLRKLFLELLPKICLVSTYSERIRQMTTRCVFKSNQTGYGDKKWAHRADIVDEGKIKESNETPETQSIKEFQPTGDGNGEITITLAEKIKLESRIFALVMDRLAFICFLIFFISLIAYTIVTFNANSNAVFNVCDYYV